MSGATRPAARWGDKEVEQLVGNLLRVGVMLAAAVTAVGGLIFLMQEGMRAADYRVPALVPDSLRRLPAILAGVLRFDSRSIGQLGVVLLIATPVARVFLALIAFVIQRDRLYTMITAIVLSLLMYSLFFSGQ
jgi:uncharacterized membrane protein